MSPEGRNKIQDLGGLKQEIEKVYSAVTLTQNVGKYGKVAVELRQLIDDIGSVMEEGFNGLPIPENTYREFFERASKLVNSIDA